MKHRSYFILPKHLMSSSFLSVRFTFYNAMAILIALSTLTSAQDKLLDRFKPRELPTPLTPPTVDETSDAPEKSSPTADAAEESTGISLRGIVLLNSPDAFNPDGGPAV
ncbi:MAG TPA: hypothetical protein PK529_05825, partial [Verrucomicrobiales bacterium]|nr:hypothetical protein [Verrucomicrobiales bacterium]